MITQKQQELIDDIMDNFDFEKVHKVMTFLNWKWAMLDGYAIPSISDIRSRARDRLKTVLLEKYGYCESGGLVARKYDDGTISLEFKIESWGDI